MLKPESVSYQPASTNPHRPCAIVRILPTAEVYTVARFFNRQDAEDHLRILHRFLPNATFEVVFDPQTN